MEKEKEKGEELQSLNLENLEYKEYPRLKYTPKRCLTLIKNKKKSIMITLLTIAVLLIIVFMFVFSLTSQGYSELFFKKVNPKGEPSFEDRIDIIRLMRHLEMLQIIADLNQGSRSPKYGFNSSLDYVNRILTLEAQSLTITKQPFSISIFENVKPSNLSEINPTMISFVLKRDYIDMGGFVGTTKIVANLSLVSNLGCNLVDFLQFKSGSIALIKRGDCTFITKIKNAIQFNAKAVLIFNDGVGGIPDRMNPFGGNFGEALSIPVFSLSYGIGQNFQDILSSKVVVTLEMEVSAIEYSLITSNLCAETKDSKTQNTIIFGAHLDSVDAGPGINDNGSGSVAILELAILFSKYLKKSLNRIRFCWWSAEELGLLGSTYYVSQLTSFEKSQIKAYINLDMIASPNKFHGIYNGSQASPQIKNISELIMNLFIEYMENGTKIKIPFDLTPFDGRSDYYGFISNETNIAAGGLFTGAEQLKSMESRTRYGGLADASFDTCYHKQCDTIDNIDKDTLTLMSKSCAFVLEKLAKIKF